MSGPGVWHELERPGPDSVTVDGLEIRRGSRVRLRPASRGDVWDTVLDGQVAVVEAIEELVDGGVVLAVSPESDPARDLGAARPGGRFFFSPAEVEPLPRILVAGIGNIFLGDDGFGCEVVRRLVEEEPAAGVDVVDFGIRGLDLAYALESGYGAAVLVDAAPLGEAPGTVTVLEPRTAPAEGNQAIDAHGMDPQSVLRLVGGLPGAPARTLVVACEPARVPDPDAGDDLSAELSEPVQTAVAPAVETVRRLVGELLAELTDGPDERKVTKGGESR